MNEMMTTKEVSAEFNIAISTLQDPLKRKNIGLKAYIQRRKLYFRRSEVEEWEKHRREKDNRRNKRGAVYKVTLVIPCSMKFEEAISHLYNKDNFVFKTGYGYRIKEGGEK